MKNSSIHRQRQQQYSRLRRNCYSVVCALYLLMSSFPIDAQTSFHIDAQTTSAISAATYLPLSSTVLFASGADIFYYALAEEGSGTKEWMNIPGVEHLDAALSWDPYTVLLFQGNAYKTFNLNTGEMTQEWATWPVPEEWQNRIDATINTGNSEVYFFNGTSYLVYDMTSNQYIGQGNFTQWEGWPTHWNDGINAVMQTDDGYWYFMRGGEVVAFNPATGEFLLAQQPAAISQAISSTVSPNHQLESTTTPAWCGCGQKNNLTAKHTDPVGGRKNTPFEDQIKGDSRVAEIKVWTQRVWGSDVISGMQTILETRNGERLELPIRGTASSSLQTVSLREDECITGIKGRAFGPAGEYIYSLAIQTNQQSFPVMGGKGTKTGGKNFQLQIPAEGVFRGFTGFSSIYLDAIGLKYQISGTQIDATPKQPVSTTTTSNGISRPTTNSQMVYRDDYMDYTDSLKDQSAFWVAQPMPNLNWLGAGFDIIKFDPLLPNENRNRKAYQAIVITNSGERAGNEAQYLKPYGTNFYTVDAGRVIDTSSFVRDSKQFSKTFSFSLGGTIPMPKGAVGSGSGSYSEINTTKTGSESIYHFIKRTREIYDLSLNLSWDDRFTGTSYRQKLHPTFRRDVAGLPVPSNVIQVDLESLEKGKPLPAELQRYQKAYQQIIDKYGTHFSNRVAFGGQYIVRTEIRRADYEKHRGTQSSFEASISNDIASINGAGKSGSSSTSGNAAENMRSLTFVQGGYGSTDVAAWEEKLQASPAPYQLSFLAIADLMTEIFFPDDPDIEKKQAILIAITTQYILDNYQEPVNGLFDFYRPLPPPEMPGNITVTNKGGYVSNFKLKFYKDGEWQEKESGHFPLGQTRDLEIPIGATNISLEVGFISLGFHRIFTKTFEESSTVKCYEIWGTVFSQGHAECK